MAVYQFACGDGSIVSAEYSRANAITDEMVEKELWDAFQQYGHKIQCVKVDNLQEVYRISIENSIEELYVCAKGTTPGGRENLVGEQRVQQKSKYINFVFEQQELGKIAAQFGIYHYDNNTVFCAWKVKESTASPETPISKQIKIETIANAMKDGFAQQEKGNAEYACAFRKEFVYFYIKNIAWIHDSRVENLSQFAKPIEEANEDDGYFSPVWFAQKAQLYSSSDIEAEILYKDFREKFGPTALQAVSDIDLLHKIFINETRDKENLCYTLEFGKQYTQFGGIGGGSALKYGLYFDSKNSSWVTGSPKKLKILSVDEAIALGTSMRDEILAGVEIIKNYGELKTAQDYSALNSELFKVMPTTISKSWVMKYFHMLFPDIFPPFYNAEWQRKVLTAIDEENDDNSFVRIGRIALFIKQCGISSFAFSKVVYNMDNLEDVENEMNEESTTSVVCNYDTSKGGSQNLIVYGTPGCGKSYYVENKFLSSHGVAKENRIRTTFYMDYTNTDFVGQILPKACDEGDKQVVTYEFNPGPFALALKMALEYPDESVALIIEELNRGNAPSIFGDIFQLLDRDDNGKSVYSITNVNLQGYLNKVFAGQYTFDNIQIPSNLYIVATMNTSDQNVFTLDTAFKRRWRFEKIRNKFEDDHKYQNYYIPGIPSVTWKMLVDAINKFIISSPDDLNAEDKQLGVYFIKEEMLCATQEDCNNKEKQNAFAYKLFEYLWDDVAKFNHTEWFGSDIKTLDQLIDVFMTDSKKVLENVLPKE